MNDFTRALTQVKPRLREAPDAADDADACNPESEQGGNFKGTTKQPGFIRVPSVAVCTPNNLRTENPYLCINHILQEIVGFYALRGIKMVSRDSQLARLKPSLIKKNKHHFHHIFSSDEGAKAPSEWEIYQESPNISNMKRIISGC